MKFVIHATEGERLVLREQMLEGLAGQDVTVCARPRGEFWETFWDTLQMEGGHWRLQDDVILPSDFLDRCRAYEKEHTKRVIRGFCQKVQEEKMMPASSFLWMQCVYLPGYLMESLRKYARVWIDTEGQTHEKRTADDYLMQDFFRKYRIPYLMAIPSLVQHAHEKSLLGPRPRNRQSQSYIEHYGEVPGATTEKKEHREWYGGKNKYGLGRGSIWQIDRKHRIMCGDCTEDDLSELFNGREIDCVYTDPPWNSAIASSFYKHAGYDTKIDIDKMIPRIVSRLKQHFPKAHMVVEFGNPCFPQLQKALVSEGGIEGKVFESYYGKGIPYSIWVGSFGGMAIPPADIDCSKGKIFTRAYIQYLAEAGFKNYCDPFVGIGEFFREAVTAGMVCHGIELNPNKLSKLLGWAEKKKMVIEEVRAPA